ncbi:CD209 antigen-like protein D isoform X1 [Austrofundulus limnaeus]|uniref:CD209 antigen-like protein D isoform X1 n=1 Tax=Austrofundulus limnaeus TaxID=52670 RepID=A0A2I4BK23_AUSLI|nr:PREDICTED: C-type lectin domain family 4 member E isoform X1 [Austrofundulus limnaeus]
MYIKFCRWGSEDKKDENSSSKLTVELGEEKAKETKGNERLFRYGCVFLTVLCFIFLLVIVFLSMKLGSGSPPCTVQQCPHFNPKQHEQLCAKGWIYFNKSCFFLSTLRLPWAESQKNCSSGGGSLAVITTQSLQSFLTSKGNLKYWIGLRHVDNSWNWVDHSQLEQSFWGKAPRDGDCAFLSSEDPAETNWDRASCKASTYFICQQQI